MPQPITQGQQQRDEGDTLNVTESPNVDVQLVTSVVTVTSTITITVPSPALNQVPGPGPYPKTGLQPPPAVLQWVQSMLLCLVVACRIFAPVAQWVHSRVGRKTPDKLTSDDEKSDSASRDSRDGDAQSGKSGESTVASTTTVSANNSRSESVRIKDTFNSLIELTQITQSNCKGRGNHQCGRHS